MDELTSETCWAVNNEIKSKWQQVGLSLFNYNLCLFLTIRNAFLFVDSNNSTSVATHNKTHVLIDPSPPPPPHNDPCYHLPNTLTFHSGSPCSTLRFAGRFDPRLQAPEGGYQNCPRKVVHSYTVSIHLIEKTKISPNSTFIHELQNPVEKTVLYLLNILHFNGTGVNVQ
jgi:hypothetical protein